MAYPAKFSEELFATILARLADGEPLSVICRDRGMPNRAHVRRWCRENSDLDKRFQEARDDGYDRLADDCLQIADNVDEDPASRKVRVWTRTQLLSKWSPRYGEKVQHTGAGGGPVTYKIITGMPEPESSDGA